jgi:hypothetical protein
MAVRPLGAGKGTPALRLDTGWNISIPWDGLKRSFPCRLCSDSNSTTKASMF